MNYIKGKDYKINYFWNNKKKITIRYRLKKIYIITIIKLNLLYPNLKNKLKSKANNKSNKYM